LEKENISELLTLWTHSSDAFLILDDSAKILYANPVLERVSGLDMKRQVGRNIRDLLKDGLINNSSSLKAIQQKKIITSEVNTSAGKQLLSTASPVLDQAGKIHRIVCNLRNISIDPDGHNYKNKIHREKYFKYKGGLSYNIKIDDGKYELVYMSKKMQAVVEMAYQLSGVDSTVLILGETGVGKELITRLIHNHSVRAKSGSLIKVNCAAIPKDLIESELFGYEPGSFTGALKCGKPGFLGLAEGGTLFLDEIAEMPLEAQSKLLGILQDGEYFGIGSTKPTIANVRIIAATNQDLQNMVNKGTFRKDLYYRLNVIPVEVPSLNDRKEDIPILISHFCKKLKEKYGIQKEISPGVINQLYCYNWPGNVRELESLIERLLITVSQKEITLLSLPKPYSFDYFKNVKTLKEKIEQFELELIREELEQSQDKYEAAKNLGISISSLFRKIKMLEDS
jgi:PAS domain S-box-containing protein